MRLPLRSFRGAATGLVALACLLSSPVHAQDLDDAFFGDASWRELGPAVFGGRIVDVALSADHPSLILVASATSGLWRTRNNGTTWECIFQDEKSFSIGDIAVDPKDVDTIWVGSGEGNNQRSSYWGHGVYKTTDGGETWTNVGLPDSHHIGRVVVHPTDSDTVYVAALGHLYTPNEERGLYKTSDGGETWERVLYIDEDVGVVDVVLDPNAPDTVYAASYERRRRAWDFDGAGPGSGIWKSTDGGATWARLGGGLPGGEIGRIGIAIYPPQPNILYATVSNQNRVQVDPDAEPTEEPALVTEFKDGGLVVESVRRDTGVARAGIEEGDVLASLGGIELTSAWAWLKALGGKDDGAQLELVLKREGDEEKIQITAGALREVERQEPRMRQAGGEIYRTEDGGETWTKTNERSVGGSPAYYYGQIRVDPRDDQRIYVLGVPVSASSDGGKTFPGGNIAGGIHVDHHALEVHPLDSNRIVLGNDGGLAISYDKGENWDHYTNLPFAQFYAVGVDMQQPYHVYGGTQDNGTWGGPSNSRSRGGIGFHDWYRIGGGDGFYAQADPTDSDTIYGESQFGAVYRRDKATGASRSIRPGQTEPEGARDRYNWSSPLLISHHNPQIIYFGGNKLFKSYNRGDAWPVVSDDLTTGDEDKIAGNVPHCTLTTIAESPLDPNCVMVGSDDGLVHLSRDGALSWENLAGRFPGAPASWWVSRVEMSRHVEERAYVSFTGYREDDFRPFLYATEDGGRSWSRIDGDLPRDEPVNVVREDPVNPDVLYVGTEFGAFVSVDRGEHWTPIDNGIPTVAVHDLVVHPRDSDLVAATHGRGFWVLDVKGIQGLTAEARAEKAHVLPVQDAYAWRSVGGAGFSGQRVWSAPNPETGAPIWYHLAEEVEEDSIRMEIRDSAGKVLRTVDVEHGAGLHRTFWNLRGRSERGAGGRGQGGRGQRGGGRFGQRAGAMVAPGTYTVALVIGEDEWTRTVRVAADPN